MVNIMVNIAMEKQASVATPSTWIETSVQYCTRVLSTMSALLTGLQYQIKKNPILVDAACQTDEAITELTVNRDWKPCDVDNKVVIDDDNHSCTTETTEVFTDAESEDYEQTFTDDDSEWEDTNPSDDLLHTICNACESCAQCDCEIQADHLLRLTSIVCTESADLSPIYLEHYLCTCGECPQYNQIAHDVAVAVKASTRQTESITRLLQAFSTYNELLGYHIDMIPAARECLQIWCGDEDKAFKSFMTLYDEVPRLCD